MQHSVDRVRLLDRLDMNSCRFEGARANWVLKS